MVFSVDLNDNAVKNTSSRHVRNRTSRPRSPETRDRRVQKTKTSLRDALIGLAGEKPYNTIAVKEILHRANVGRSTFYTHFADKDELLESGIHEVLRSIHVQPEARDTPERIVSFSLPILESIDQHRRLTGRRMAREGRDAMHTRLKDVVANLIMEDVRAATNRTELAAPVPADLVARHVASTFVLVLDWWLDRDVSLSPAEVDARFRVLVQSSLADICGRHPNPRGG